MQGSKKLRGQDHVGDLLRLEPSIPDQGVDQAVQDDSGIAALLARQCVGVIFEHVNGDG